MISEIKIPTHLLTLGLKGNDLLVAGIIYTFGEHNNTKDVELSQSVIAQYANATKPGIIKNIDALIAKGVITKTEGTTEPLEYGGCINHPNTYHINF